MTSISTKQSLTERYDPERVDHVYNLYARSSPIGQYLARKKFAAQPHLVVIDFRKRFRHIITRRRMLRHRKLSLHDPANPNGRP